MLMQGPSNEPPALMLSLRQGFTMKPRHLYPWNFLALEDAFSNYGTANAVILPIPYEATVSYGAGTRNGPQAIITASRQVETYDAEFGAAPCEIGIATLGELEQIAGGPDDMMRQIEDAAAGILADGKFLMSLGGEHSISPPLVCAHKAKYPKLSVLQFDAHTDLRPEYQGSKNSHACAMSRIWESCGYVGVGVRSFCGSENEIRAAKEGRLISARDLHNNPALISNILSLLTDDVYITFDLDGFDPSVIPSVGTPEPGGLLWEETLEIIKKVSEEKRIVGADVVELAPIPGLSYPDFAAARLTYKIISYALWNRG
jgi:agmatinase